MAWRTWLTSSTDDSADPRLGGVGVACFTQVRRSNLNALRNNVWLFGLVEQTGV